VVGRLKPGITIHQAQVETDVISAHLEERYPDTNDGKALLLTKLHDAMVEDMRSSHLMLLGAVTLLLLLACGNVAGLLLARGQSRREEIAIRAAIGATRRRLVRQLITESILIAIMGGLLGLLFALNLQDLLIRLLPAGQFGIAQPSIDVPVLLFALGISITTGILFGVVPALQSTYVGPTRQLSVGVRATSGRGASILRSGLIVFQVAISTMLLIGAGLFVRSLGKQMNVDLGFNPANLLVAELSLPEAAYPEPGQQIEFFTSVAERVEALPGVTSVGIINRVPIRDVSGSIYVHPPEQSTGESRRLALFRCALPGYFKTMGIPLLAGRDIAETDGEGSPRVMIISESMAEFYFPDQNPLGQKLNVDLGEMVPHEVVGIVGNARLNRITSLPSHAMYMSFRQVQRETMRLAVRTLGNPSALIRPIRQILLEKDRNVPMAEPATMISVLDDRLSDFRIVTISLGLFSSFALLLALVGLYGVLAYYVSQRYHEIGVRIVLGATRRQVAKLILSRGMGMVVVGLLFGLAGSYWATRLIQQLLFEIEPTDPATFILTASFFAAVALLACLLPAMRATRIDPAIIIQAE